MEIGNGLWTIMFLLLGFMFSLARVPRRESENLCLSVGKLLSIDVYTLGQTNFYKTCMAKTHVSGGLRIFMDFQLF